MIRGSNSCYPSGGPHDQGLPMYSDVVSSPSTSFLYNLSILKDKVHQVQSLAILFVSSDHSQPNSESTTGMAIASVETLIQEIIVTSSSMMFTCQQLALGNNIIKTTTEEFHPSRVKEFDADPQKDRLSRFEEEKGQGFYSNDQTIDHNWFADNDHSYITCNTSNQNEVGKRDQQISLDQRVVDSHGKVCSPNNYDIVELEAADLLAKYTHYCQVCGKGFKRDANLRMHMRAHGDEYKSSAALINPLKHINKNIGEGGQELGLTKLPRKYSCPQEGCRWNKKHAKFQPLKSMICVKNHYRRSHCPKMYVCKRCNRKQFSVLSDLRTHEKHCGDLKWQCSCGTTFSRKDKLIGHVALFVGHSPAIGSLAKMGKPDKDAGQMQLER